MGVFRAFFGRRGVVGFNGCCSGVRSGDGGFTLARVSGCRGVVGFKAATWLCPVRVLSRPLASADTAPRQTQLPRVQPAQCGPLKRGDQGPYDGVTAIRSVVLIAQWRA